MTFSDYQRLSARTVNRSLTRAESMTQNAMGIAGEAGECVDMVKKHLFHGHVLDREALVKELGDSLWYLTQMASDLGVSLEDVARQNIDKLEARYPEGFSERASIERVK